MQLAFQDVDGYLRTSVDIQQRGAAGVQADISIREGSVDQTAKPSNENKDNTQSFRCSRRKLRWYC
jgi:hypothetical protein